MVKTSIERDFNFIVNWFNLSGISYGLVNLSDLDKKNITWFSRVKMISNKLKLNSQIIVCASCDKAKGPKTLKQNTLIFHN